ncbi:hypothetical protein [Brevundimonas sp. C43]|uniref:hypothetical protein n=1 Tax=Brevundimonas sp. C43 TaxID=3068314 RepID=UPI00273F4BA8|nr:hypothetical protein [Brevundimonas sp. C43]
MSTFTAGVHYDDFKGSVAADVSDKLSISEHLVVMGNPKHDEPVVAFSISSSGISGQTCHRPVAGCVPDRRQAFEPAPKRCARSTSL